MKYPGIIKNGSLNAIAVQAIKARLNYLGLGSFDLCNPSFGPQTEAAVKQFQKNNNLIQDGVIGELTWSRMFQEAKSINEKSQNISILAMQYLLSQTHVRELTGKNDGEAVESYLKSVGLGKSYAWCTAFIYWGFNQAAKKLNIENPLYRTAGVLALWNNTSKDKKFSTPKIGDIFIMDFGKGNGHTGMVTAVVGDRIHTIEGNTSSDPMLPAQDREGNGVFERSRKTSSINKGFIRI